MSNRSSLTIHVKLSSAPHIRPAMAPFFHVFIFVSPPLSLVAGIALRRKDIGVCVEKRLFVGFCSFGPPPVFLFDNTVYITRGVVTKSTRGFLFVGWEGGGALPPLRAFLLQALWARFPVCFWCCFRVLGLSLGLV